MKRRLTLIVIGITLLPMQFSIAASAKNTESKLAMLELSQQIQSNRASTSPLKKKAVIKFPSNCLSWNAKQINRKAKPFDKTINKYSRLYRIDSNLVKSVITAESCFKIKALSSAGAQGLMQLIPATAERFGVRNSYKPEQNIRGGIKYLKFLNERYKGDLKKMIAAYNAGEGNVDKYKGIPPFKETQQYVKNVLKIYTLLNPRAGHVKAIYHPPKKGAKPGRHGWQYNRHLAPHLYKQ